MSERMASIHPTSGIVSPCYKWRELYGIKFGGNRDWKRGADLAEFAANRPLHEAAPFIRLVRVLLRACPSRPIGQASSVVVVVTVLARFGGDDDKKEKPSNRSTFRVGEIYLFYDEEQLNLNPSQAQVV
ncbi:uncharacterized protein EV420DRAFT_1487413 [Desarmillaria tabescens]|uniref:Uncharacterized protein n=1 Tax=Armillaria tabescens TaxID=1929756 RepID=A0AA39J8J8_ARMTA|nr:uncharacterized protein EV420DRAFT_1487413 [Desarmillaria tabescens]KAK0436794.1 hypothetical protein EV420DRAFT_1487413 [Desarmillaria tabescens]